MSEQHAQTNHTLAIVGGGFTGLKAAYDAVKKGQNPHTITVYEATERQGGKIRTGYLNDGTPVNMGAEFVDSDHVSILELCKELGVKLNPSTDQGSEIFQKPDGTAMAGDDFHKLYEPLAARIRADKAEVMANPNGELAKRINNMSMNDYLTELRTTIPAEANPGIFRRLVNAVTNHPNQVDPMITTMAMQAFASEMGQPPEHINALQYLHEASSEAGSFLESDCAFRVDGGTENIIHALEKKLREMGVKFEQRAVLSEITPTGSQGAELHFEGRPEPVKADGTIIALPTYALGRIRGLEKVGMSTQTHQLIAETQYTNSLKFTVKTKPGVQTPKDNFFANHGFQVWSAGEGQMTFLVNADKLEKMTTPNLVRAVMDSYAKSMGKNADALFDMTPGNINLNNPGRNPCYASPAPGQARALEQLEMSLAGLTNGVAVAGTFIPARTPDGVALGFMECGAQSAAAAVDKVIQHQQARPQFIENIIAQGQAQDAAGKVMPMYPPQSNAGMARA